MLILKCPKVKTSPVSFTAELQSFVKNGVYNGNAKVSP